MPEERIRLNRLIARYGVCSRRAAEDIILAGRVSIDGEVVTELGVVVSPDAVLAIDGEILGGAPTLKYLALSKPSGYITTRSDEQGRRTVMDLLPKPLQHLHPVGRLDFDTLGLLLMTNDGGLTQLLTHPRHGVEKIYQALVIGCPSEAALNELREGVYLAGGRTAPAKVELMRADAEESIVQVTVHEGRNRQVKRMLHTVGHRVIGLKRVAVGPITLGDLRPGRYRDLSSDEVAALRACVSETPLPRESE